MLLLLCSKSNAVGRSNLFLYKVDKDMITQQHVLMDSKLREVIVAKKLSSSQKFGFGCVKGLSFCSVSISGSISEPENYLEKYENVTDFEEVHPGEYIFCTKDSGGYYFISIQEKRVINFEVSNKDCLAYQVKLLPGFSSKRFPLMVSYDSKYISLLDLKKQKIFRLG